MSIIEELNSLDFNDISSWTRRVKLIMTAFLAICLIFAGYHFIIKKQQVELDSVERKEPQLKKTFSEKRPLQ